MEIINVEYNAKRGMHMTKYMIIRDGAHPIYCSYNLTEYEAKMKVEILRSARPDNHYRILTMDGEDTYW